MSAFQTSVCPNCGFAYGWDGKVCRHCKHGRWASPKDGWLLSQDGAKMLLQVPGEQFTPRKRLLLACGCLRGCDENKPDSAPPEIYFPTSNVVDWLIGAEAAADGDPSMRHVYSSSIPGQKAHWVLGEPLARVVRDLFLYPVEVIKLRDDWLSTAVVRLGETIYESSSFEDMPALGDALEEAGCTDEDVLRHCRHESFHFRGCWLLDLVLGKE